MSCKLGCECRFRRSTVYRSVYARSVCFSSTLSKEPEVIKSSSFQLCRASQKKLNKGRLPFLVSLHVVNCKIENQMINSLCLLPAGRSAVLKHERPTTIQNTRTQYVRDKVKIKSKDSSFSAQGLILWRYFMEKRSL